MGRREKDNRLHPPVHLNPGLPKIHGMPDVLLQAKHEKNLLKANMCI